MNPNKDNELTHNFLESLIRKIFFILVLIALANLLLGYSERASSATLAGSCNNAKMGFCNEFTGSSYTAVTIQGMCGKRS